MIDGRNSSTLINTMMRTLWDRLLHIKEDAGAIHRLELDVVQAQAGSTVKFSCVALSKNWEEIVVCNGGCQTDPAVAPLTGLLSAAEELLFYHSLCLQRPSFDDHHPGYHHHHPIHDRYKLSLL